jgi:hypothetical protein
MRLNNLHESDEGYRRLGRQGAADQNDYQAIRRSILETTRLGRPVPLEMLVAGLTACPSCVKTVAWRAAQNVIKLADPKHQEQIAQMLEGVISNPNKETCTIPGLDDLSRRIERPHQGSYLRADTTGTRAALIGIVRINDFVRAFMFPERGHLRDAYLKTLLAHRLGMSDGQKVYSPRIITYQEVLNAIIGRLQEGNAPRMITRQDVMGQG